MLIKELHETFFGKEDKNKNTFNNYINIEKEENKENEKKDLIGVENKKIFKFNRNNDKREIKLKESKSNNNIYDNKYQNDYINLYKFEYNKKKEIEIDINKVLGIKNKIKKVND